MSKKTDSTKSSEPEIVQFSKDPTEVLKAGPGFRLSELDPQSTPGYKGDKADGVALLENQDSDLEDLQERLFAASRAGAEDRVLLVLQAMDTAGKGGIVSHVVGAMDVQGVRLKAFKAPTDEEKQHDFLWRIIKEVPEAGEVGVFDRSHYEDVLIHRVHGWADDAELNRRYAAINEFEAGLIAGGTRIVKVMLHISNDEQRERLLSRIDDPTKHWKYSENDLKERGFWSSYQDAFQRMFENTSTEAAPWYVVPANRKWYARIAVQELLLSTLRGIDPQWPKATFDVEAERAKVAAS